MRIVCPSCAATYDVPEAALAPGRAVRCARCGTEWAPLPAPPAPAGRTAPERVAEIPTPPPPPPRTESRASADVANDLEARAQFAGPVEVESAARVEMRRPETALRPPRRAGTGSLAVAWLVSLALLVGLAGAAYAWRDGIMAAWPPSERLYGALGLARGDGTDR